MKPPIRAELDQHIQSLVGNGRRVEICVCYCGYHMHKDVWDLYIGDDSFTTKHEQNNQHNNNVTLAITHAFTRHEHKCMFLLFWRRLKVIQKPNRKENTSELPYRRLN